MNSKSKFTVALMGARMHYAVPRQLHLRGLLERCCIDIGAVRGWPRVVKHIPRSLLPKTVIRLGTRIPEGIPSDLITAFTSFGLEYKRRQASAKNASDLTRAYLWGGKKFCELVIQTGLQEKTSLYCYNSAGLEMLKEWKRAGRCAYIEQTIAPRQIEEAIIAQEGEKFPGWQGPGQIDHEVQAYIYREKEEWAHADLVICGSEFVQKSIINVGGPASKCVVVPYGIDSSRVESFRRTPPIGRALRVLTVGEVGLRKGSQYVLEAAKALRGRVDFRMAGSLRILPERERELRNYIDWVGIVPRDQINVHYNWADVFLLPSLCEGSAIATYEAQAAGLPIIVTPSTGSVVVHGVTGFLVEQGNALAIVDALETFMRDQNLLSEMSAAAIERRSFSSECAYGTRLAAVIGESSRP